MASPFIFSRAQFQRKLRQAADQMGLDFRELVVGLYPCPTRRVLEELDTRGLACTEAAAIAWALENRGGISGGPYRSLLWDARAIDGLAEYLDMAGVYTAEAIQRREAGRTAADMLADHEEQLRQMLAARNDVNANKEPWL